MYFDFDDLPSSGHGRPRSTSDAGLDDEPSWKCWDCGNNTFMWTGEGWKCADCRGADFYQTTQAARHETEDGVWVFMPRHASPPQSQEPQPERASPKARPDAGNLAGIGPSDPPPSMGEAREFEDSETATEDPIVDPDTMTVVGRRRNRRSRKNKSRAQYTQGDAADNIGGIGRTSIERDVDIDVGTSRSRREQSSGLTQSNNNLVRTLQRAVDVEAKGSDHSE